MPQKKGQQKKNMQYGAEEFQSVAAKLHLERTQIKSSTSKDFKAFAANTLA